LHEAWPDTLPSSPKAIVGLASGIEGAPSMLSTNQEPPGLAW
jgi:hypothetical protein